MKANKFFAVALAALTLVGFNACKPGQQDGGSDNPDQPGQEATLALDKTSISLEVEGEETITATIEVSFESSDPTVASVTPANDGKSAKVTALKEGSAVITAKSKGGQVKTCVVAVKKKGGDQPQGGAQLKGSQVWPVYLDGPTAEANASKIVFSFAPDDVEKFLYNWNVEGNPNLLTYSEGTPSGMNFHGNTEGYLAWIVGAYGWAGAGFNIQSQAGIEAAEALRTAIIANPDDYFLHLAMKSTDNFAHCFYFLDNEATKFVIGNHSVYDGAVYQDFVRDGAWHEFDIPLSSYAAGLANKQIASSLNVFVLLSEGTAGAQMNLDAVYFYKK